MHTALAGEAVGWLPRLPLDMCDRSCKRRSIANHNLVIRSGACRANPFLWQPMQKTMFNMAKSRILNPFLILLPRSSETSRERRSFAWFIEATPSQDEIRGAHVSG